MIVIHTGINTNVPCKRDSAGRGLVFLKYGVFDFIIIYFLFLDPQ